LTPARSPTRVTSTGRQVLARRAALVELLYTQPVLAGVVVAERTA
jgi:hypothetical protein